MILYKRVSTTSPKALFPTTSDQTHWIGKYQFSTSEYETLFGKSSNDPKENSVRTRHLLFAKKLNEALNFAEASPLGPPGIMPGRSVNSGYKRPLGEPDVRNAISTHVEQALNIKCPSEKVVVTEGSINGLHMLTQALALQHSGLMNICTLVPTFTPQRQTIHYASAGRISLKTHTDPATLLEQVDEETKAFMVTGPPNPPIPGFKFTTDFMKTVGRFCHREGLLFILDSTYLEYDDDIYPLLKAAWDHCPNTVIITSVSKIKSQEPRAGFMLVKNDAMIANLEQCRVASTVHVSERYPNSRFLTHSKICPN